MTKPPPPPPVPAHLVAVDGLTFRYRDRDQPAIRGMAFTVQASLDRSVDLTRRLGLYAESKMSLGTDIIQELDDVCQQVSGEWPKRVFFTGQLAFEGETWWTRLLHNQTSFTIQRRLLFSGLQAVILPIRVRLKRVSIPKQQ
jgi:hypothetical protein